MTELKAQMLARWVAGASTQRLDAVMDSPLRRVVLWQIFRTLRRRFDADRAAGVDAVVEFRIRRSRAGSPDRFQVVIAGGRCTTTRGGERIPTVTLDMSGATFLRLVGGADGAPKLVLLGRLRLRGDPFLAARLPTLLNVPKPRRPADGRS